MNDITIIIIIVIILLELMIALALYIENMMYKLITRKKKQLFGDLDKLITDRDTI